MAMGQATGTAAAFALNESISVQDINMDALVGALQAQNVNGLGGMPLRKITKEIDYAS
jgi:hypothetical protein